MKPTILPSSALGLTYAFIIITMMSGAPTTTVLLVQASTVSKFWKKIDFFASSNGSMINETMKQIDEIQPFVCPTLKSDVICTTDWDPYICGNSTTTQCEYSNDCVAQGSGFNVTTECIRSSEPSTELPVIEEAASNCPTHLSPDFFCTAHWDPYECGINKCFYGNDCEAWAAGFNVTTNCTRVATSVPTFTTASTNCPTIPSDLFCEESWKPYLCVDQCQYSNDCYASASGFNVANDCIPLPV